LISYNEVRNFHSPAWPMWHKLYWPHHLWNRKMRRGDRLPRTQKTYT